MDQRWRASIQTLSLSPAPRPGERAVVILVHQKLLLYLRPSYCAFDFCSCCFCRANLILLLWVRVTVLSCLAPVHPFIPHYCFNGPKQLSTIFFFFISLTVFGIYWYFLRNFDHLFSLHPGESSTPRPLRTAFLD